MRTFSRRRFIRNTFQHRAYMGQSGTPNIFRKKSWSNWMPFVSRMDRKYSRRVMKKNGFFD